MAKDLWLLRHGEAVPHDSRSTDADRELTPRGEAESRAAGVALSRLGVELAACYTSPKARARDTARLACLALGTDVQEAASVAGGFDVGAAAELLLAHGDGDGVLVVGHDPDFTQLVRDLTGARAAFPKGGVAHVRLDGRGRGELRRLLRPVDLEALAR